MSFAAAIQKAGTMLGSIDIPAESGVQPDPIAIEYGAAKGALNILMKGLAKAYAEKGVLVNAGSPISRHANPAKF